ncbi:YoqO family protein [Bacillus haynesii]|uniref:YoqO family protein n=1 Tax=Bacillus haynesii TaxID=1925021 RepID=UPI00228014F5|nr:YoqO family protein [Bacillus haynesii]MCY8009560.1 YoqO family protein [Bacillus haynesii]MCY9274745.1 YoqO family protein [Bacillus haynesii]MEC0707456.1 YoqO family protein [Bacillus haynesii]MEC0737449.1 YoqO family protein [Bacillus haynesii]
MLKTIGFYGFLASVGLNLFLRAGLKINGTANDIISMASLVFVLMYVWDDLKKRSAKTLILQGISLVIFVALLVFVIMKGQTLIASLPFFEGWETPAKWGYILLVLFLGSNLFININEKITNSKKEAS